MNTKLMDFLTLITEATVSLTFFVACLPCLYFSGFHSEAITMCAGLALTTYLTSAMKDLLCAPRPVHVATAIQLERFPPAARDFARSYTEYGAPSLHTSAGLFMALFLVHVITNYTTGMAGSQAEIWAYGAALCWGLWIGLTRMYLGVHSPLDLVLGGLIGGSVFKMVVICEHWHYAWTSGATVDRSCSSSMHHVACPLILLPWTATLPVHGMAMAAAHAWALISYPAPMHSTESFEHATTFLGAWAGVPMAHATGFSRIVSHTLSPPLQSLLSTTVTALHLPPLLLQTFRVVVGLCLVFVTRKVVKLVLTPAVLLALDRLPAGIRARLQPPLASAPHDLRNYGEHMSVRVGNRKDGERFTSTSNEVSEQALDVPGSSQEGEAGVNSGSRIDTLAKKSAHQVGDTEVHDIHASVRTNASRRGAAREHVGLKDTWIRGTRQNNQSSFAAEQTVDNNDKCRGGLSRSNRTAHLFVQRRPDGYPCDADMIRRYICYCCMVVVVIVYTHAIPDIEYHPIDCHSNL
ncbi:hypothetical protein CEUSTIGMA_g9069.t1 [Chlamydomonas eustigma]|uniref:Phosphatidic acid phosphatase type 2/haloperoxidase domain-containing protein n=1 Tax=Chlamydomonas eustigma TaxID=1157962 RepID=A0A250XF02_9CHLO|nr:hypothetical protein CEUSTIGMA_g9069.t1 [Chlamydomonas eustigma]|eukprot:GAX81641.1 hypothetical protein CEUSTIGMA_g9069.t1 [Chlamydomonas eustigma]